MGKCNGCEHCSIHTDDDLCTRAKCLKWSKKGKQITWSMTIVFPVRESGADRVKAYLQRRKEPSWCPLNKEESK